MALLDRRLALIRHEGIALFCVVVQWPPQVRQADSRKVGIERLLRASRFVVIPSSTRAHYGQAPKGDEVYVWMKVCDDNSPMGIKP